MVFVFTWLGVFYIVSFLKKGNDWEKDGALNLHLLDKKIDSYMLRGWPARRDCCEGSGGDTGSPGPAPSEQSLARASIMMTPRQL